MSLQLQKIFVQLTEKNVESPLKEEKAVVMVTALGPLDLFLVLLVTVFLQEFQLVSLFVLKKTKGVDLRKKVTLDAVLVTNVNLIVT